jgi:hypothetical protein
MKNNILFIFFLLSLFGCTSGESTKYVEKKNNLNNSIDSMNAIIEKFNDSLGNIVSTISFKTIGTKEEREIFEDGIIPWINIDSPDIKINALVDVDKIVLPYSNAKLIIDYPLDNPAIFLLTTKNSGFTKRELIHFISEKYYEIYNQEESTSLIKTLPLNERKGLINRNETKGKFGICCHDISDLDLSSIEIRKNKKGEIHLTIGVES